MEWLEESYIVENVCVCERAYIDLYIWECVYMQINLTVRCENFYEWMCQEQGGSHLCRLLCSFASIFSLRPSITFLYLQTFILLTHHLMLVGRPWEILRWGLRILAPSSSPGMTLSATFLIPSSSLGRLPAACIYLFFLWCNLISSHLVVLWDKHGLVCLITGFHVSVGIGQKSQLQCLEFRNAGSSRT